MRTSTVVLLATVMALQLTAAGCAKNASERRAASPTMSERMSKESVKGRSQRHRQQVCVDQERRRRVETCPS